MEVGRDGKRRNQWGGGDGSSGWGPESGGAFTPIVSFRYQLPNKQQCLYIKYQTRFSFRDHMLQEPRKEEFNDWPHGFLAIGTFGNYSLREDPERCNILRGNQSSSQNHHYLHDNDLSPEEVGQLEKELAILLRKQVSTESTRSSTEELVEITHNLRLDNFNFPTSLKDDKNSNIDTVWDDSADKKSDRLQRSICSTSVILNRGKDIRADHSKNAIGRISLCFLLKKMFLCRNGLTSPTLSLRDPIPEKSRMEKILRAILHKKIYPQNSSSNPKATAKKYLETISHMHNSDNNEGEMLDTAANDGSKWVKTDSELCHLSMRLKV
ncbi:hypothetical protein HYC85_016860 [Camellia sinensis]|uniref:Uncharacterized protein n=1 Tax=Camellia sinensis TaxID=4442 RepID=A0A7J7H0T6_CAMSI|nr:hypothetical protein HYC85_016860 [Camellia sinensis]